MLPNRLEYLLVVEAVGGDMQLLLKIAPHPILVVHKAYLH